VKIRNNLPQPSIWPRLLPILQEEQACAHQPDAFAQTPVQPQMSAGVLPAPAEPPPASSVQQQSVQTSIASAPATLQMAPGGSFPLHESQGLTLDKLGGLNGVRGELKKSLDAVRAGGRPAARKIILEGEYGSGKTALTRAFAGELYGVGTRSLFVDGTNCNDTQMRGLFAQARQEAGDLGWCGVVVEDVQVLSNSTARVLAEELQSSRNVLFLGTTTNAGGLANELQESVDRKLAIGKPVNAAERLQILNKLAENQFLPASPETLSEIAAASAGATPGELLQTLRLAQQLGGPGGITSESAREARMEKAFGPPKEITNQDWMFRLTVCHELGHVVARHVFQEMATNANREDHQPRRIDGVSFAPRGPSNAAVFLMPSPSPAATFEWYFAEVASNLAGRSAEYVFGGGHVSAGPGSDIRNASDLVHEAIHEKGMGKTLGPVHTATAKNDEFQKLANSDEQAWTKTADKVAASVVHFYAPFIEEYAAKKVEQKGDLSAQTVSGKELSQQLKAWENADPQRAAQLGRLQAWIGKQMDGLRPELPEIFDPARDAA
jgi:hypothetical protein